MLFTCIICTGRIPKQDHLTGFVLYMIGGKQEWRTAVGKHFCLLWTTGMPEEGLVAVWQSDVGAWVHKGHR